MRKAPLQKPDRVFRFNPLKVVLEDSKVVSKVLLLDPNPLHHQTPRQRCFCGNVPNDKMLLCEACNEWYHLTCVGMDETEAAAANHWRCGYCRSPADEEGKQAWALAIPQGNRKKPKVAAARLLSAAPRALGVAPDDNTVWTGPSSWAECVALAKDGARKIHKKEAVYKAKALKLVKEGGHHVVDEMDNGGVRARGVDGALIDDLLVQGLIQEEVDDADAAD